MPTTLHCHLAEYTLPPKASLLDRLMLPIAETLGTAGYRHIHKFDVTSEGSATLQKDSELTIDAATLQRPTKSAKFRVVVVEYKVQNHQLEIEVELKEIKPAPLQRWYAGLSDQTRVMVTYTSLTLFIGLVIFSTVVYTQYPEPLWFWGWVGQNIRGLVSASLFILFLAGLVWSNTKPDSWLQDMTSGMFGLLAVGAPVGWMMASAPPAPMSAPQESIAYLNHLLSQWQTATPLLAGVVPWGAMLFKWLGWDMMAEAVEMMGKQKDS
jgi:hypothetical protein